MLAKPTCSRAAHHPPDNNELIRKELRNNRKRLEEITGQAGKQCCYPQVRTEENTWLGLRRGGVIWATCEPGMASPATDTMLLPAPARLVDTTFKTHLQFEFWLSGAEPLFARPPAGLRYRSPLMSSG